MINCKNCSHFHHFGDKLMCDHGFGEVLIIGHVKAEMTIDLCKLYDGPKETTPVELVNDALDILQGKKKPGRPPKNG